DPRDEQNHDDQPGQPDARAPRQRGEGDSGGRRGHDADRASRAPRVHGRPRPIEAGRGCQPPPGPAGRRPPACGRLAPSRLSPGPGLGVWVAAACGDSATSGGGADETGSETSTTGGSEGTNASPTESSSDGITTGEDDTEDTAICVLAPSGGGLGFCDYPPSTTTGAEEPPGEIVFVRW